MEQLLLSFQEFAHQHIDLAPYAICGLLLLAGLNIPISEDGMIFLTAMLAVSEPDHTIQLFIGLFTGAYVSDLICYAIGRHLGPRLWEIKFFAKMVSRQRVEKMSKFYEKYGVMTLIIGRFIPFGVRNGLFLTAGFSKMSFKKFAFSDFLACSISTTFFFSLYYRFGEDVIGYVKRGNVILFSVAAIAIALLLLMRKAQKRKNNQSLDSKNVTD
jgi:membrane-associated protein